MAARGNWGRNNQNYYGGGGAYPNTMIPQMNYYMNSVPQQERRFYNNKPYRHDDRRKDDSRKRPRSPDKRHENRKGKYEVRVAKHAYALPILSPQELKHRISGRSSVPQDLCQVTANWVSSFPCNKPVNLSMECDMHILHRDTEAPPNYTSLPFPSVDEVDFSWSVRVMILGTPSLGEMMKQSIRLADETSSDKTIASKLFSFIVASKSKTDHLMIGGPWCPAKDGPDPANNPKTIINIGIRYAKTYLGLDLSTCTEWIRFIEIHYHREPGTKAPGLLSESDREISEECNENVVFLIPIISPLLPTDQQWEQLKQHYSRTLERLMNPKAAESSQQAEESFTSNDDSLNASQVGEASHWSKLDVNNLKVSDLKNELVSRGLDGKGLKAQLISRLQTALDEEKSKEESNNTQTTDDVASQNQLSSMTEKPVPEDSQIAQEEDQQVTEKERRRLERMYRIPEKPCLLIHPNWKCNLDYFRVSLCSLLDQRHDHGETGFEICIFAHQFHEMLQRDAAFNIMVALNHAKSQSSVENGEGEEPMEKKQHLDEQDQQRKYRRTPDPRLLFSFAYFDSGNAEYIRESDMLDILASLDLGFSRNQLKKSVDRMKRGSGGNRDSLYYRSITDVDVIQGSVEDVTTLEDAKCYESELLSLTKGNLHLPGRDKNIEPARIFLGATTGANGEIMKRLENAESVKRDIEFRFHKLKDELDNTRLKLNTYTDVEDRLKKELHELQARHKTEVKTSHDQRQLVSTYGRLLRDAKGMMERCLGDINRQFDKQKEKDEALKQESADDAAASKKQDDIVLDTA